MSLKSTIAKMKASGTIIIEEAVTNIRKLMAEKKWLEAHRECLDFLRYDPENLKIIRLKNKIEKTVKQQNRKAIREDLAKLGPLWHEKQYEDLLKHLRTLEPYIPDYPPLKNVIVKAQKLYAQQVQNKSKEIFNENRNLIEKCVSEKKFSDALVMAEKMLLAKDHEEQIRKLVERIKSNWIQNEIEQNQALLKSEKFEDILLFYQGLLRIDKKSKLLKKAIETTKKRYQEYKIDIKKEFIFSSLEKIRTLYQLKKYEKVVEAAQEVLNIDPLNNQAESFLKKSSKKTKRLINKEVVTQMSDAQKKLKEDWKAKKDQFIKL